MMRETGEEEIESNRLFQKKKNIFLLDHEYGYWNGLVWFYVFSLPVCKCVCCHWLRIFSV